jgi:hypothetical protein
MDPSYGNGPRIAAADLKTFREAAENDRRRTSTSA